MAAIGGFAMGFVAQQLAQIEELEQKQAEQRQWQLHKEKVISRDAVLFCERLQEQLVSYVTELNAARKEECAKCWREDQNFIVVQKDSYPSVKIIVTIDPPRRCVFLETIEQNSALDDRRQTKAKMSFDLDSTGNICLGWSGYEAVAESLLKPVFEALKPEWSRSTYRSG